jgi:hypothetical protein
MTKKEKDCCENELPYTLVGCIHTLGTDLLEKTKEIKYYGDISDFGNEIGHSVGLILKNMTERQITDFIHGLRHGISVTNGTH